MECVKHRYLRKQIAKVFYVPATNACYSEGIFVAATNITNPTNKAGTMCH